MIGLNAAFEQKQTEYYKKISTYRLATPGSQYVLQLLAGGYLEDYKGRKGMRALDVGCGRGFNLVTFDMLGFQAFGCEISKEIAQFAQENIQRFGINAEVLVGVNQSLPFPTEHFDLLLSNNVIHYVEDEKGLDSTLAEYARVLKSGGRILLQTTHPDNWILKGSSSLGGNFYRLETGRDYRDGEVFFVFPHVDDIKKRFGLYFCDIQVGINRQEFFVKQLANWVVTGVKK